MHRARRTISQAPRMIRMRVREHDRLRMQPLKFSQPIKAAIDHHIGAAIRDHRRGTHGMPSRALLDLTARAKERQFHCGIGPGITDAGCQTLPQWNAYVLCAARLISSSDAGFSKADVSPSFSPKYAARTMRRITFAFRVFGMSPTKITSRGASALPRSRATFSFNSAASAIRPLPDQFGSFFKTQKQ